MAPSLVRRLVLASALTLAATSVFAAGGALSLVPADAVSVGVVRVADRRSSPLSSTLFQHADRFGTNGEAAQLLTDAGLDLAKDIDVLVVATSPVTRLGSEGEVLVLADGRFSVDRLSAALVSRGAVRKANYFTLSRSLNGDCTMSDSGFAATVYPVISGYNLEDARVENLAIDGNRSENPSKIDGCRTAGIFFYRGDNSVIANCVVNCSSMSRVSFVTRAARLMTSPSSVMSLPLPSHSMCATLRPRSMPLDVTSQSVSNCKPSTRVCRVNAVNLPLG